MRSMIDAAMALESGRTTARDLVEDALAAIADPDGEGRRAFVTVYADQARQGADAMDALRRTGRAPGPYAGIPISLKDLFDVAGETTAAGSRVLAGAAPAPAHAPVVQRLLQAGFVPVGRTNMTEFAFSGLGLNPHFGNPRSPYRRGPGEAGHISGGSSSGAAVSVADGMALAAIGTDTGGSCRIPAAFCGITGFKPTARRVPLQGVLPLAPSLDSVGPLAPTVGGCAALDAILAGEIPVPLAQAALSGLRLAVPTNLVLDGADAPTQEAFERALARLSAQGARLVHLPFPQFERILAANAGGGFAAPEAYAWHRQLLSTRADQYDPRVQVRIQRGAAMPAADYLDLVAERATIIASMDAATAGFDALVMPTVPIAPPTIASLGDDAAYARVNALVLRNPSLVNFLDRCAISLPMHRLGEAPAGLSLVGETGGDARLFSIAAAVEMALSVTAAEGRDRPGSARAAPVLPPAG